MLTLPLCEDTILNDSFFTPFDEAVDIDATVEEIAALGGDFVGDFSFLTSAPETHAASCAVVVPAKETGTFALLPIAACATLAIFALVTSSVCLITD